MKYGGGPLRVEEGSEGWILLIRGSHFDRFCTCVSIKWNKKKRGSTVASIDPHRGSPVHIFKVLRTLQIHVLQGI